MSHLVRRVARERSDHDQKEQCCACDRGEDYDGTCACTCTCNAPCPCSTGVHMRQVARSNPGLSVPSGSSDREIRTRPIARLPSSSMISALVVLTEHALPEWSTGAVAIEIGRREQRSNHCRRIPPTYEHDNPQPKDQTCRQAREERSAHTEAEIGRRPSPAHSGTVIEGATVAIPRTQNARSRAACHAPIGSSALALVAKCSPPLHAPVDRSIEQSLAPIAARTRRPSRLRVPTGVGSGRLLVFSRSVHADSLPW